MLRRALPWLVLLSVTAAAYANVALGSLPDAEANPGEYVTFAVPLTGNGTATVEVAAPAGWQLVSTEREVTVEGSQRVPFTARVPTSALAGTTADFPVTVTGPAGTDRGSITVRIRGQNGMTVTETSDPHSVPGEPLTFTIEVTNTGNEADTLTIAGRSPGRQVHVFPDVLTLGPFQSAPVTVTVPYQGRVNYGYRLSLKLHVTSENSGETVIQDVDARYERPEESEARAAPPDPQLQLRINTGARAGVRSGNEGSEPFFEWSLRPELSGDLSDFVQLNAYSDGFHGTEEALFNSPSYTNIGLNGPDWEAGLTLGSNLFGVRGALEAAGWRFNAGAAYSSWRDTSSLQLEAGARSGRPELDLQFHASVRLAEQLRGGSLSGFWRTRLSDSLQLGLGLSVSRYSSGTEGPVLGLTVTENLTWLNQAFDVQQTLSSSPGLGRHSLSLTGGTRSARPFGVRALARSNVTPDGNRLYSGIRLQSIPTSKLRLNAGLFHETSDIRQGSASLRLQAGAAMRLSTGTDSSTTLALKAEKISALTDNTRSGTIFSVDLNAHFRRVSMRLSGAREHWLEPDAEDQETSFRFQADATLALGPGSDLEARFRYRSGGRGGSAFAVRWQHAWSPHLSTNVHWRYAAGHRFDVALNARDVFTSGLSLSAGYGVEFGGEAVRHSFNAGISYAWVIPFDTPEPLVRAFGGRETGGFEGTALLGSGSRAGEPLQGITVRIGSEETTTGADGRFSLRVPEGTHRLRFENLPATIGYIGKDEITIERSATTTLNPEFVPVSVQQVTVFQDDNRNGIRDPGEESVRGIRVELSGPRSTDSHTDGDGNTWFTALPDGHYRLSIPAAALPAGFETTGEPRFLNLDATTRNPPVELGIAPVIREVVTTYQSGRLSVSAWLSAPARPAGAEVTVFARTGAPAETVSVDLFGREYPLQEEGGSWSAELTVPENLTGLQTGTVHAVAGDGQEARTTVRLLVTEP